MTKSFCIYCKKCFRVLAYSSFLMEALMDISNNTFKETPHFKGEMKNGEIICKCGSVHSELKEVDDEIYDLLLKKKYKEVREILKEREEIKNEQK